MWPTTSAVTSTWRPCSSTCSAATLHPERRLRYVPCLQIQDKSRLRMMGAWLASLLVGCAFFLSPISYSLRYRPLHSVAGTPSPFEFYRPLPKSIFMATSRLLVAFAPSVRNLLLSIMCPFLARSPLTLLEFGSRRNENALPRSRSTERGRASGA